VNGRPVGDPEFPVQQGVDRVEVDGREMAPAEPLVLMLNKPRGLVTTARDERGRATVYQCFEDAELPWVAPVGRLDRASEGLLLFTNNPVWAARVTDPLTGPEKTYHVQVDRRPDEAFLKSLVAGTTVDGEHLAVRRARVLREGDRNAWLELVLDEGRNRHLRSLLDAQGASVLRLERVSIGAQTLGAFPRGQWRVLDPHEWQALA
jgi:23S rRNA pseudouridine2605 synthase